MMVENPITSTPLLRQSVGGNSSSSSSIRRRSLIPQVRVPNSKDEVIYLYLKCINMSVQEIVLQWSRKSRIWRLSTPLLWTENSEKLEK